MEVRITFFLDDHKIIPNHNYQIRDILKNLGGRVVMCGIDGPIPVKDANSKVVGSLTVHRGISQDETGI